MVNRFCLNSKIPFGLVKSERVKFTNIVVQIDLERHCSNIRQNHPAHISYLVQHLIDDKITKGVVNSINSSFEYINLRNLWRKKICRYASKPEGNLPHESITEN